MSSLQNGQQNGQNEQSRMSYIRARCANFIGADLSADAVTPSASALRMGSRMGLTKSRSEASTLT